MEVEIRKTQDEFCYKCGLGIDGILTKKSGGHCPRCAYDIDGTIDMETLEVFDAEAHAGQLAFLDLMLMLNNWANGYLNIIARKGVDWSLPHEYLQEFYDHMCPYIKRLCDMGYNTPERSGWIRDTFLNCLYKMFDALEAAEEKMKLDGTWNAKEIEIKEHWQERIPKFARVISGSSTVATPRIGDVS